MLWKNQDTGNTLKYTQDGINILRSHKVLNKSIPPSGQQKVKKSKPSKKKKWKNQTMSSMIILILKRSRKRETITSHSMSPLNLNTPLNLKEKSNRYG